MNKNLKAAAQMRKEGINAFTAGNGTLGTFVNVMGKCGQHYDLKLTFSEVEKWADLYDKAVEEARVQEMKDTDPYEILEEIARIFHHLGWHLGECGAHETDFVESSDKYLELVYRAFNPIYKK
jgi:hypothetical protein